MSERPARLPRFYRRRRRVEPPRELARREWWLLLGIIGGVSVSLIGVVAYRGGLAAAVWPGIWVGITMALLLAAYLATFAATTYQSRVRYALRRRLYKEHLDYERTILLVEQREKRTADENDRKTRDYNRVSAQLAALQQKQREEPDVITNLRNQVAQLERQLLTRRPSQ